MCSPIFAGIKAYALDRFSAGLGRSQAGPLPLCTSEE